MLELLAGGTPQGPDTPLITAFGAMDPEWGPFVIPDTPPAISQTVRALGRIADVTGMRHPSMLSFSPFLN